MTNYRITKIVLIGIFLISLVKLGFTLSEWYPHFKYLSSLESKLTIVLQQEVGYSANQRQYLNSDQNYNNLDIWYCEVHIPAI